MSTNRDLVDSWAYSMATLRGIAEADNLNTKPRIDYCRVEGSQEGVASNLTVTYTTPGDGITTTYDLGKVKWNAPDYVEVKQWEAHLCARDGQVLLMTDEKAPWYARLFARLLGLEWKWLQVTNTQVAYGGQVLAWTPCVAGGK